MTNCQANQPSRARIALVCLPFSVTGPSLGLSLLKSALQVANIAADVHYLSLDYLSRIGLQRYGQLTHHAPTWFADLVFKEALWPKSEGRQHKSSRHLSEHDLGLFLDVEPTDALSVLEELQNDAVSFIDECLATIPWRQYDIIGLTSTFQQTAASLAFAKRLRTFYPEATIVMGGANCEAQMGLGLLRAFPFIDNVFSGASEITFPAFAKQLLSGNRFTSTPGVFGRSGLNQEFDASNWVGPDPELDSLPFPDFDDYVSRWTALQLEHIVPLVIPFEGSRGCWWGEKHHCTFCGLNGLSMRFRSKAAERLLAEIKFQVDRYNPKVKQLTAVDNILDMKYFDTFIPRLQTVRREASIFYEVKSNLTRRHIDALQSAGVIALQPGIESLDTDVLRLIDKGCTTLINVRFLRLCAEAGLEPGWNILYGFPSETRASYERTLGLIPSLTHLKPPESVGPFRLDRFSPYFEQSAVYRLTNCRPHWIYQHLHDLPPSALNDIAYYFEFDYVDPCDLSYGSEVDTAVRTWKRISTNVALVGFANAEELLVWDTRPVAQSEWTSLRGLYRHLLLECDDITSASSLLSRRHGNYSADECGSCLAELARRRFLVSDGDDWLSVVVLAKNHPLPAVDATYLKYLEADGRTNIVQLSR